MIDLVVATYNQGKLAEFAALLKDTPFHVVRPGSLGLSVVVEECGSSYAENARLKAEAFLRASGLPALGDDSGLEVDALQGEPGLHSARYAGAGASDPDRYHRLLNRLAGVPWEKRTARFKCVLAFATPGGATYTTEGVCEGLITLEPDGGNGFGYDPVFFLPKQQCTMAQLAPDVKNQISHRAIAAKALRPILEYYASSNSQTFRCEAQDQRSSQWAD